MTTTSRINLHDQDTEEKVEQFYLREIKIINRCLEKYDNDPRISIANLDELKGLVASHGLQVLDGIHDDLMKIVAIIEEEYNIQ